MKLEFMVFPQELSCTMEREEEEREKERGREKIFIAGWPARTNAWKGAVQVG